MAGKGLSNENQRSAIAEGISRAKHVHELAKQYGATLYYTPTIVQKIYCRIDGLLDAGEIFTGKPVKPLYSSHMLDLRGTSLEENIEVCKLPDPYGKNGDDPRDRIGRTEEKKTVLTIPISMFQNYIPN